MFRAYDGRVVHKTYAATKGNGGFSSGCLEYQLLHTEPDWLTLAGSGEDITIP